MIFVDLVRQIVARFRYPVSLPEDVAKSLGISLPNSLSFDQFVPLVSSAPPTRLKRFMPREEAEAAFHLAVSKERFAYNTLFSFHFNEGRVVFILNFDEEGRLRRMYLQHKRISSDQGLEIPLCWEASR